MIDSNFRAPYQRLVVHPILKWKGIHRFSPQMFTLIGALTGILIPFCLYFHRSILALIFLTLSGFFDTLDGSLARHLEKTSPKGAALDITADRLVEFSIIMGLYLYFPEERGLASLGMLGAILICVTTFLVVAVFEQNDSEKSFHYSPGLIERGEAFIFFTLMILFPFLFTPIALIFTTLTLITAYFRISQFLNKVV